MSDVYCDCKVGKCEGGDVKRCAFRHHPFATEIQSLTQRTEVLTAALEKARQHLLDKHGECPIWINQALASKALPPPEGE